MDDPIATADPAARIYCCPGEEHPIERSVHVARLLSFYPGCLGCEHRHDTVGLTRRQLAQRAEVERRAAGGLEWTAGGVDGKQIADFDVDVVRRFAAALAGEVWRHDSAATDRAVLVGSDGDWSTADFVSAACSALELSGCRAVEVGAVTTSVLAHATVHHAAAGALWIGNASGEPHAMAMRAWQRSGEPASSPGELDALRERYETSGQRNKRSGGSRSRLSAEATYLPTLAGAYHGLRPLVFLLDTTCEPLVRYWRALASQSACRLVRLKPACTSAAEHEQRCFLDGRVDELARAVPREQAHFGLWIDGAGGQCRFVDELGRHIAAERFFLALALHVARQQPGTAIVLADDCSSAVEHCLVRSGARTLRGGTTHQSMAAGMHASGAVLGGDRSGRCWFPGTAATPDALAVLSLLLSLLSESDRPASQVLDAILPGE